MLLVLDPHLQPTVFTTPDGMHLDACPNKAARSNSDASFCGVWLSQTTRFCKTSKTMSLDMAMDMDTGAERSQKAASLEQEAVMAPPGKSFLLCQNAHQTS